MIRIRSALRLMTFWTGDPSLFLGYVLDPESPRFIHVGTSGSAKEK